MSPVIKSIVEAAAQLSVEARTNAPHGDMVTIHAPNGSGTITYGDRYPPRLIAHGTPSIVAANLTALLALHERIQQLSGTREHNEDLEADAIMSSSERTASHSRTRDELKMTVK